MTSGKIICKQLGENIKRARKELGMTQSSLAEISGISETHISNIEKGETWISCDALAAISNALKVSPAALLVVESENCASPADELNQKLHELTENFVRSITQEINRNVQLVSYQTHREERNSQLSKVASRK